MKLTGLKSYTPAKCLTEAWTPESLHHEAGNRMVDAAEARAMYLARLEEAYELTVRSIRMSLERYENPLEGLEDLRKWIVREIARIKAVDPAKDIGPTEPAQ